MKRPKGHFKKISNKTKQKRSAEISRIADCGALNAVVFSGELSEVFPPDFEFLPLGYL